LLNRTEDQASGFQKPSFTQYAAAEIIEQHSGCAGVHGVVPIEANHRIGRAINIVDTIIHKNDRVAILSSIWRRIVLRGSGRIEQR
jgi:hypothetical protein